MLLKKITRIFSETGMPCISKNRVFLKISGLNLIFFQDITSMNIEGLKKGSYDLIFGSYSANEPNIEFILL